jgi:peptidoglycan/LPS O-acetylase OafA/YrhL
VPYLPGLDGLRALAVVAVMIYHANHEWLGGGFLGVEVFFVISGYLITLLLIGEHERNGMVSLRQFWKRRARRLLPALFVLLGGLGIYMALFERRPQGQTRGDFIGGLVYGSNWYQIVTGQGYTASEAFAPLRHLWSLAVEEQFYLIWPLVMVLILRRGRQRLPRVGLWLMGMSAAIAVVVAVLFVPGDIDSACSVANMHGYWRLFGRCININETLYLSTFARAGGLMLGAGFAMIWRPVALLRGPMRRKGHLLDVFALLGLGALGLLVWRISLSDPATSILTGSRFDPWLFRGGFFVTGLATLLVIAAVTHRRAFAGKVIGNPLLRWLGTRSYGLYLFHWPVYEVIRKQAGIELRWSQFALAMAITVPVTEFSYRYIETPIRHGRLGEWLRGERRAQTKAVYNKRRTMVLVSAVAAALIGFAGVSIATATNQCVGDVACSLVVAHAAAESTVVGEGTTTSSLPGSSAVTTSTTSGAPRVTSTTGPSATVATLPIGGTTPTTAAGTGPSTGSPTSAPAATAAPTTTLAPSTTIAVVPLPPVAIGESVMAGAVNQLTTGGFYVDAVERRQGTVVASTMEAMRANGQLGSTVVVQTGTNGPVSDATFARIMATLPANLTPNVYFLTVRADGKGWIADNNVRINSLPLSYSNVHIIDWANASAGTTLCKDGIHVACGGGAAQFYANLIFDGIGHPELDKAVPT